MPNNKRHHYLPQFYLRKFGEGDSIAVFNLARRKHIRGASIAGQCQRSYLYGRDGVIEGRLRDLETAAASVMRRIIFTETLPPETHGAYRLLLVFVAFQHGRTPLAGALLDRMGDGLARAIMRTLGDMPTALREQAEGLRLEWESGVFESLRIAATAAPLLSDLQPKLLLNETTSPFITSDSAVVLFNSWSGGWKHSGVTGFASSGLLILLPISPRHLLLLFDRDVYSVGRGNSGVVRVDHPHDIDGLNAVQLVAAERNLYYQPSPEAVGAVDRLPFHWHRDRVERVRIRRAVSEQDGSTLVFFFQEHPDVRLTTRTIRIKKAKARIPLEERARSWRQAALDSEYSRELRKGARRLGASNRWRVIRDE